MRIGTTAAVLFLVVTFLASGAFAQEHAAYLKPLLNPNLDEELQPFAGQVYFTQKGGLGQPCSVTVELTSLAPLADTQFFYFEPLDPYELQILPEDLVWSGPIDSGAGLAATFSFEPHEVGRFEFIFSRKLGSWRQSLARLSLALDEDGQTLYAGLNDSCQFSACKPHPWREADTLVLSFEPREVAGRTTREQDFGAVFKISPAPGPGVTSNVNLQLECHEPYYKDVQFILEHTTTLMPSALPESWGQDAGPNPRHRFYDGAFTFRALAPGMGIIIFKVVGERPEVRFGDHRTTEFQIFYVVGYDGKLRYIGYENPWERYSDPADPMLGSVSDLLEKKYDRHQFKNIRSKPDYLKLKEEADSGAAAGE
ncbi:MAG: hypothetical protein ABIJ61_02280 [bacterium]